MTLIGTYPLKDQLEPQLKGGPDPSKPFEELCMLRNRIPNLDDDVFKKIFPGTEHCILCITQKTGTRHFVHLSEAAFRRCSQAADDDHHTVSRLGRSVEVPVLDADIASQSG